MPLLKNVKPGNEASASYDDILEGPEMEATAHTPTLVAAGLEGCHKAPGMIRCASCSPQLAETLPGCLPCESQPSLSQIQQIAYIFNMPFQYLQSMQYRGKAPLLEH